MKAEILKKYENFSVEIKASIWFLIGAFFQKGIAMISTPIFTRIMNPEEYGEFNVFNSWLLIISIIVTCQISAGVYTQGIVKFDSEKKEFSSSMQGLNLTLVLFWIIVYTLTKDFWNSLFQLSTFQMYAILIISWLLAAYNFWAIEQRVDLKYRQMLMMTVFVTVFQPLICIILVMNSSNKVDARILGILFVDVVAYLYCFVSQFCAGRKFFIRQYWKYSLLLCIPLIPHYLSQIVMSSSDRIMIERMVGMKAAGIYSLAYSVSQIMTVFNTGLMQTIEPWLYKKIKKGEIEDLSGIAYKSIVGVAVVNVLLIIFSPEVVRIFAPSEYYDAIWVIPPVAMSVFVSFLYAFFAVFEFYYEKTKYITIATLVGAVINIGLNYLLIPHFGYYAAGYTTLISYMLYVAMHYVFMNKICKENGIAKRPYDFRILLCISFVFFVVSLGILFTYKNYAIRYTVLLIFIVGTFFLRKKIKEIFIAIIRARERAEDR
ncbi:MAG: oligosaccharide flippase family protein [Acetatifactor sp.]|nr:oligosaccharide flippase family protein [Acetatifactor sp.]